jgi:hypothetical protein
MHRSKNQNNINHKNLCSLIKSFERGGARVPQRPSNWRNLCATAGLYAATNLHYFSLLLDELVISRLLVIAMLLEKFQTVNLRSKNLQRNLKTYSKIPSNSRAISFDRSSASFPARTQKENDKSDEKKYQNVSINTGVSAVASKATTTKKQATQTVYD